MRKFKHIDGSMSKKIKLSDTNTPPQFDVPTSSIEGILHRTRSTSKLFDALENFNKVGSKRMCDNFVIFESDQTTYSVRFNGVIAAQTAKCPTQQTNVRSSGCKKRHMIAGTGRVAFSGKAPDSGVTKDSSSTEEDSIRMIYRMTAGGKAPEESMQWSEFTLGSPVSSKKEGVVAVDTSVATNLAGSFITMTVSGDNVDNNSNVGLPAVPVNKFTGKPIISKGGGSSISNMFKKSAAASGSSNNVQRVPSSVFNKGSSTSSGLQQSQQLGVGVGGRAAAMARMAVLGEEWPEEEELPGAFSTPSSNVTTSGSAATAGVSREVGKEVHNAHQRTQKIKAAKRG